MYWELLWVKDPFDIVASIKLYRSYISNWFNCLLEEARSFYSYYSKNRNVCQFLIQLDNIKFQIQDLNFVFKLSKLIKTITSLFFHFAMISSVIMYYICAHFIVPRTQCRSKSSSYAPPQCTSQRSAKIELRTHRQMKSRNGIDKLKGRERCTRAFHPAWHLITFA